MKLQWTLSDIFFFFSTRLFCHTLDRFTARKRKEKNEKETGVFPYFGKYMVCAGGLLRKLFFRVLMINCCSVLYFQTNPALHFEGWGSHLLFFKGRGEGYMSSLEILYLYTLYFINLSWLFYDIYTWINYHS